MDNYDFFSIPASTQCAPRQPAVSTRQTQGSRVQLVVPSGQPVDAPVIVVSRYGCSCFERRWGRRVVAATRAFLPTLCGAQLTATTSLRTAAHVNARGPAFSFGSTPGTSLAVSCLRCWFAINVSAKAAAFQPSFLLGTGSTPSPLGSGGTLH
jgi:hypothetical protein